MKKGFWARAAASLSMMVLLGTGHALAADPSDPAHLEAVKQYEAQIETVKEQEREIRSLKDKLKSNSRELRSLVRDSGDKSLKAKVRVDLKVFHDHLAKAHELRMTDEELKKEIHAARLKKDLDEERRLAAELVENKKAQLSALKAADNELQQEIERVRKNLPSHT